MISTLQYLLVLSGDHIHLFLYFGLQLLVHMLLLLDVLALQDAEPLQGLRLRLLSISQLVQRLLLLLAQLLFQLRQLHRPKSIIKNHRNSKLRKNDKGRDLRRLLGFGDVLLLIQDISIQLQYFIFQLYIRLRIL